MEAEQAARQFSLFYLYPRGDGGTAVPDVDALPAANFMFWHSTSVHILLAAYPIMLFSGGDIRPSVRYMGKCFLLLLAMAVPIYCVNLLLDTNFMFLMYAPDGNPLAVVPRPCWLPLDRLPRAARGGVRADGRANHAQKAERG